MNHKYLPLTQKWRIWILCIPKYLPLPLTFFQPINWTPKCLQWTQKISNGSWYRNHRPGPNNITPTKLCLSMSMSVLCNPKVTKPFLTSQQTRSFIQIATRPNHEYRNRPSVSFDETSISNRKDEHSAINEKKKGLSAHNNIQTRGVCIRKTEPKLKSKNKVPGEEKKK